MKKTNKHHAFSVTSIRPSKDGYIVITDFIKPTTDQDGNATYIVLDGDSYRYSSINR